MKVVQKRRCQTSVQLVAGQWEIEEVSHFMYLRSVIAVDGGSEDDVNCRIGKAAAVYQCMCKVWYTATITTDKNLAV